jgi:hypothetical protein
MHPDMEDSLRIGIVFSQITLRYDWNDDMFTKNGRDEKVSQIEAKSNNIGIGVLKTLSKKFGIEFDIILGTVKGKNTTGTSVQDVYPYGNYDSNGNPLNPIYPNVAFNCSSDGKGYDMGGRVVISCTPFTIGDEFIDMNFALSSHIAYFDTTYSITYESVDKKWNYPYNEKSNGLFFRPVFVFQPVIHVADFFPLHLSSVWGQK